jgi:PI4-kinase N-terminal region
MALLDLCRAHPRRLASAVDAVRTFLLAKLVRIRCGEQVVAVSADVCEYVVNVLTELIVMQLERETPEASRSLLNNLSNVLYTSYRKYKNAVGKLEKRNRKGDGSGSGSGSGVNSGGGGSPTTSETPQNQQNENLLRVVTTLLGRLAMRVGHVPGATVVVVTPLVRRITESLTNPLALDGLFVDELARVACAPEQKREVYESVADLLINTYRNILHRDAKSLAHVSRTFPGACLHLAHHLPTSGGTLEDFQLRVLRLMQSLSIQIQKMNATAASRQPRASSSSSVTSFFSSPMTSTGSTAAAGAASAAAGAAKLQRSTLVGTLGSMLPVLATVLQRTHARSTVREEGLRKLCRNVWFFAVFFEFVVPDRYPLAWYEAVCRIAVNMPVLYTPKHYTSLETSIEFESYISPPGSADSELSRLRRTLADALPSTSLAPSIRSFSAGQCAQLLCLFYLETLRISHDTRSSSFRAAFR